MSPRRCVDDTRNTLGPMTRDLLLQRSRPSEHQVPLDSASESSQSAAMTVARIIEEQRKTTQSGKAGQGRWTLEFERQQPQRPDPLTGWNGSGDTATQVRLKFDTKEEALAYAERKGFAVHLVPAPPVSLKLQAYADNFR